MRLLPLALAVALCGAARSPVSAEGTGKAYGDGVTHPRAVRVAALLENPQVHAGKTVRVDGVVTQVCQAMGCWVEIADPALRRGIRFKAKDGVIVFPKEAVGRRISAQGTFEEISTSPVRESHGEHAKSAESSGRPTAAASVEKLYWVRVTGAVLF